MQMSAAERLSRGYSTMVRTNGLRPQQLLLDDAGGEMLVGKLRAKQMRAQERRQRLVFQFTRPGFTALKGQTIEFPVMPAQQQQQQQQPQQYHHQQQQQYQHHPQQQHYYQHIGMTPGAVAVHMPFQQAGVPLASTRNWTDLLG